MAWVVVEFSDQTVGTVPVKWLTKVGKVKKCFYPNQKVVSKVKVASDVDKKSKKWSLHGYRLLMNGKRYATYELARKAENIATNHSTMASFENSYSAKQKSRKRPIVHFNSPSSSSSSETENQDSKNIKILSQLDRGLAVDFNKKYNYVSTNGDINCPDDENHPNNQSFDNDNGRSSENEKNRSSEYDEDQSVDNDSDRSIKSYSSESNKNSNDEKNEESSDDNDNSSNEDDCNNKNRPKETDDSFLSENDGKTNDIDLHNVGYSPIESTVLTDENINSSNSGYNNFTVDRRLARLEHRLVYVCNELNAIKADLMEIKKESNETNIIMQSSVQIFRDLSVEVFGCKEEIKKRNGMFTDLLVPDIQFPIENTEQYDDVESALGKHKIVDNLIKYLGSTINESGEKGFIEACVNVIFEPTFFMDKVWWKKEPGKVLIKNSQILHCIRESFKTKFGLVEPKRSDKAINKLIHETCTNMKDRARKSSKAKKVRKAEGRSHKKSYANDEENKKAAKRAAKLAKLAEVATKKVQRAENDEKADRDKNAEEIKISKKVAKRAAKLAKKAAEVATKNVQRAEKDDEAVRDKNAEEIKNPKKAAKRAAKLAKQAAELATKKVERAENDVKADRDENAEEIKNAKKAAKRAAKLAKQAAEVATKRNENRERENEADRDENVEEIKEAEKAVISAAKLAKQAAEVAELNRTSKKRKLVRHDEAGRYPNVQKTKKSKTERGEKAYRGEQTEN